ncbi:shikimate kinase [Neobacillus vireti]|uniref:Shikimate kinase n=1 Tax=Neobacillus vireti LMG 21834 TaxID=1131730 RepID=A0AB94IIK8_9BACI|nr:shikimate kinase [Neobacillus vireti]ETI66868.1 shikimate kinase [Neobacillus vireti LMG 21834]KLT15235.1 shikimate kinase [Neobacillus vireti]
MNNIEVSLNEKNIILIGFMGVGKTTAGMLVAKKLQREFIDIDEEIEKEFGIPVSEIFNKLGEKTFREKEKSVITSFCEQKNKVLSLGGGAFLQEKIRSVCLTTSYVIFLDLSFEKWKERISQIIDSRPVLQGKSLEEMKELFTKRQETYAEHHLKVVTDEKDPEVIAQRIINEFALLM